MGMRTRCCSELSRRFLSGALASDGHVTRATWNKRRSSSGSQVAIQRWWLTTISVAQGQWSATTTIAASYNPQRVGLNLKVNKWSVHERYVFGNVRVINDNIQVTPNLGTWYHSKRPKRNAWVSIFALGNTYSTYARRSLILITTEYLGKFKHPLNFYIIRGQSTNLAGLEDNSCQHNQRPG